MGGDRHSIIEAGMHMRMAVLTIEEVMRTAGRSELHRSGAGPVAAYNLGRCYYFGRGVDKNLEMAQELFKEAEEGGFPVREKLKEKL